MLINEKIKFKNNFILIFVSKIRTINYCLFVCLFVFCARVQSQACYNNITDANGIIISQSQINVLESASCRLIDSLPSMYRDSFKVYDFGFYAHNERMLGGLPQIFLLAIDTVKSRSKYYVLFGKQFDSTGVCTKFWVDLSLPRGGQLSCLNDTKVQQIKNYVDYWVNNSFSNLFFNPYSFHISQSLAIDSLASTISKIPTCCLNNYSNCMNCLSRNDIKGILDRKGFRKLPIEIQPPVVSKQKDTVSFRNTALYSIIDSANLEIKINDEILSVYNSLVGISTFCSYTFKAYITKNENFCPGLYFFQADNEYASPNGYDAVIWFHIFDDDTDSLYIKWLDFRKPGNDVFGFEFFFGSSNFFPNFQNEPSQNTEERIVHLSTNGLIDSLVPIWAENPRDWQHKIPKIKTSSGEILTTNDPTHDDVLLCNYNYDMFRDTAFKEITDLEEIKRLGINLKVNPHCYKGSSPTCRLFCKDLPFFFNYNLATIKSFYADGGIEYRNNFERFAKAKESLENGKMDYTTYYLAQTYLRGTGSIMACPHQYDAMVSIEKLSTFYRFESMDIAFNLFDFGNFIWGGAMRKLGFTKETALKWANAHNMATRGFTQDAPADQRAISAGYDAIHD